MLTLGLKPADALFPIGLAQAQASPLDVRPDFQDWLGNWESKLRNRLDSNSRIGNGGFALTTSPDSVSFLPPPPIRLTKAARDTTEGDGGILGGALGEYADIGMVVRGRGELGGAWQRFKPCDPAAQLTCNPGLFPQIKPDVQFGVLVGGTISDRIHVNVDYDDSREFDAANNINVYYQGLDDEILQRLEVGDVSIRLPASRYLTQGLPAGNFGFKATGQIGPVDVQTVWAQQRGDVTTREFRLAGTGNTQGLVQEEALALDDADYVKGQFFFLLDPDLLTGAPHVDVLALRASDAPGTQRPRAGSIIEIYRDERPSALNQQQQAQLGYFLADAHMPDDSRTHRGLFKRLYQDKDYVLHPSGLWIMLRAPLRTDEALAVSYITENGDTIGTVNAETAPPGTTPALRLLRGPAAIHQPNFPTWKYEMHNVYRVHSASTVEASSLQLAVSLGQVTSGRTFVNTTAGQLPYIKLFGLDEDAPADVLDLAQIYQPSADFGGSSGGDASGQPKIGGTFVVLPTLRPFFEPAPVGSANLSATEAKLALGNDANRTIYDDVDPINREGAARFRLNFKYRVRVDGLVSSFNLGALGIREESERITIGTKQLERGVDYNIDYDIGLVTLTDAASLFATNPGQEIRAKWEQKSAFQLAPTSMFGMNARYSLGTRGELNFVGLYQNEKTIMARPQLGVEPGSIFLGGTSARLDLGGALLDRALSKLPGLRLTGGSSVVLNGEAAFSMPNPNTRNEAYIDDFESAEGLNVDLRRRTWRLGSRPDFLDGASAYLPGALNVSNAARMVWQHDILQNGNEIGGELPSNIDTLINVVGTTLRDNTMWITLGEQARPVTGRRWRSITTVLSTTAIDLSRSEYIEFYVNSSTGLGKSLIFDIGTVGEDAFYFDEQGNVNPTHPSGRSAGLGVLDEEARLAQREIWGPDLDANGLYGESCRGIINEVPPLGDVSANCARGNNLPDTEDLDGNGVADLSDGAYYRYVVPLDDLSQYKVRDRSQTGTLYELYRIPLRDGIPVNGATIGTWRFIKHLRMTVTSNTAQPIDQLVLTRMRIVGSRWVKRDLDGVNRGLLSDEKGLSAASAVVQVSPVSRLTHGAEYSTPSSVRDAPQDPTQGLGASSVEFNEKGLSIKYASLGPDERADVYFRYAQQPRSFLSYRKMQLWAVARDGNFGASGDQRLVVKVGTDARNYYFYQTRLNPEVSGAGVTPNDWLPQLSIDFEQWFELKAKAEVALLRGELTAPAPGQPYVLFSADSTYGIVLEDRARAPNLAAVRELAFGVYNGSTNVANGEVWLNDIRLGSAFRDAGVAGNVTLDIRGGDFMTANIAFANQGAVFRQLNQDANYLAQGEFSLSTSAQLGQLMPASWGIEMPLTVVHAKSSQDPTLLEASDVQAARLDGLRDNGSSMTRIGMSLRKRSPSSNPILSAIVDGTTLRLGYNTGNSSAITLRSEASGFDGSLVYSRPLKPHEIDIVPGFVEAALRLLVPAAIENSDFFKRFASSRLRYTPSRIGFSTAYFGQERRSFQYDRILMSDSDRFVIPIESPRRTLDADASMAFQLFSSLDADIALRSSRDLLPTRRASNRNLEQVAIEDARGGIGGVDLGWETNRSLTSQLNYRPLIASWLKPSASFTARFGTDRSPSYLEIVTVGADTTAILQRRFQADRTLRRQLEFAPYGLYQALVPDTTGFAGFIGRGLRALQLVNLAWNGTLGSQFERQTINPGPGYQLGLGDLGSFRIIGVDSAVVASETGRFDASTGIRFSRAAQLDILYANSDLQAFDQRGGSRTENEVVWPNVRLNWGDVPLPGLLRSGIRQLSLTGSYQHKTREQALGFTGVSDRGSIEHTIPFTARMTLTGGVAMIYSGNWLQGTSDDPTGDAEQSGMNHSLTLTATVKPPRSLGEKLKEPLRANIGITQNQQRQCRFRTIIQQEDTETACVSFLDYRNRTVNLTLDTNVSDLVVGLQMGYTNRQDFVGTRRGSSNFQLSIFANFELPVGQLPAGQFGTPAGPGGGIR